MSLSIIIVTYHHEEMVYNLLKSIEKYNDIAAELEVIIVDNSMHHEVHLFLEKQSFSFKVKFIDNTNNGYGAGNNLGAKNATFENLLFLNPDIILVEPIFKYALAQFEKYDMFGISLIHPNRKKNYSYRSNIPYTLKSAIYNRLGRMFNIFNKKKYYILGADIFIKKKLFFEAGMFDETIFMYNEEFDLTQRVLNLSEKIGYASKRCMIHLEGSGEYEEFDFKQRQRFLISYKYICTKYNIDYIRMLKKQYRFLKIRRFINKIKNKELTSIDELIHLYGVEIYKEER